MRIAHLSDIHVLDLTEVRWTRFLNKRLTGLVNLVGHRKNAHPQALLEAAVAELAAARDIDHVVITGDLSNLALESEFARARELLSPLAGRLSVIPGNHDVYTRGAQRSRRFEGHFGDWMWTGAEPRHYPWLKLLGPGDSGVALLGFSSAVARLPFIATGVVDAAQITRLEALVAEGAFGARTPVALVHHNLHARGFRKDKMHGLAGREAFLAALSRAGVKLLLHGHTHVAHRMSAHGLQVIGSGSSTWASEDPRHIARYNVYDLGPSGLEKVEIRTYHAHAGAFVTQRA